MWVHISISTKFLNISTQRIVAMIQTHTNSYTLMCMYHQVWSTNGLVPVSPCFFFWIRNRLITTLFLPPPQPPRLTTTTTTALAASTNITDAANVNSPATTTTMTTSTMASTTTTTTTAATITTKSTTAAPPPILLLLLLLRLLRLLLLQHWIKKLNSELCNNNGHGENMIIRITANFDVTNVNYCIVVVRSAPLKVAPVNRHVNRQKVAPVNRHVKCPLSVPVRVLPLKPY